MSPVSGGGAGMPVAVCGRLVSVFRKTMDWPAQVVTLTGVAPAAELQLTVIGDELTVICAEPVFVPIAAWIATGPPTLTPRARPFGSTVATLVGGVLQVGAGAPATALPS